MGWNTAWTRGGGAFYGPKLDFKLIDAIGRSWQGPTVQLDFNLPERFGLEYIGEDNERHRPVMLHRVLVGSMERFVGGLIEHFAGAFPLWLAPEQVRVLPISEQWVASAQDLVTRLRGSGIRAGIDDRDTLSYRIRDAELHKVPYMAVVGEEGGGCGHGGCAAAGSEEEAASRVAGRLRGSSRGGGRQQAPGLISVRLTGPGPPTIFTILSRVLGNGIDNLK